MYSRSMARALSVGIVGIVLGVFRYRMASKVRCHACSPCYGHCFLIQSLSLSLSLSLSSCGASPSYLCPCREVEKSLSRLDSTAFTACAS